MESIGSNWPKVAVVGAGAVGCYFGGMLAKAGAPVTLIGRGHHMQAIAEGGLDLDALHFQGRIPVAASTDLAAAHDAGLVLFCLKTPDTEDVARALAPHLRPETPVLSLQNGVDNAERIRAAAGLNAIPAVVYVAAMMTGPGRLKHSGRGDIVLPQQPGSQELAEMFQRAGIPCRISENIQQDLWKKMILNSAYNGISALCRAKYGPIMRNPHTHRVVIQVVEEAVAVAQAAGIDIQRDSMVQATLDLAAAMDQAVSSTAQDIYRGKRTEIDSFNGFVARRGAELGVAAPVNETIRALVKLLEESENK